jgi:heme O synthase-like polyprenyltransferase
MGYYTIASGLPSPRANFVAIFLTIWQIPHFLLLMGIYGKEYEKAGLASITQKTNESNLYRMSILWLMACCTILFLFPLHEISSYLSTNYIIVSVAGLIFILGLYSLIFKMRRKYLFMFILTNLMQLTIVTCLMIDHLS